MDNTENQFEVIEYNFLEFFTSSIENLKSYVNFCYPNNTLVADRMHSALSRFFANTKTFDKVIIEALAQEKKLEDTEKTTESNFSYLLSYCQSVAQDIHESHTFAYPNNQLDNSRAIISLQKIASTIDTYSRSSQLFIKKAFSKEVKAFHTKINLLELFEMIDMNESYMFAYPNNTFDAKRCHTAFEMLSEKDIFLLQFIKSVDTENLEPQVVQIIHYLEQKVSQLQTIILEAYPNNVLDTSYAHATLSKFIEHYKGMVEQVKNDFSLLNSVLEKKEAQVEPITKSKFKSML